MSIQLWVNGNSYSATPAPGTSLLTLLRQLGWMGVRRACDTGDCGSCTVWVNEQPIHSCIYPAWKMGDRTVTTVEGLARDKQLTPMQQAFLDRQGFQCGYCTAGMLMSLSPLDIGSEAELRVAMDGNLCRCTGYQAIVESALQGKQLGSSNSICLGRAAQTLSSKGADLSPSSSLGQSIPKQDGPDIVTGQPIYTADWTPPGLLHLKVVRSPYAHARIRHIDTTKAKALAGVRAIFTHADVERRPYTTAGHAESVPDPHDHYLLDTKVRFVGDRVAAVVAESPAIAEQACQLIEVDYEILPHVLDPLQALQGEILIHDEPESFQIGDRQRNLAGEVSLAKGSIEEGFAAADVVLKRTYQLPALQHFHLEPHVCTSWLDPDGTLVVRSSTQVPFHCQRILCELFDRPKEKVRVFKVNLGGGFGNKQEILTEDLCALAVLKTGQPVQWEFTRHEEFTATTSRHAMQIRVRVGAKQDGTLTAMEMEAIANTGAYGNHGEQVVFLTGSMSLGLYRCPHQRFRGLSVYTNTMPAGAFRGYGATQGIFAVECILDELACQLDLDPIALKRKQLITPADTVLLGRDEHFHLVGSCGLETAVEQVVQILNYQPGMPPVVDGTKRRGVGFTLAMQGSGLAKIHPATARITLQPDGRYELRTGAVDVGTGSDTTLRQIAAEVLGTSVDRIDIVTADTHRTPFDAGSYASATLYISGQATRLAAQALRSRLLEVAGNLLNVPAATLDLQGADIRSANCSLDLPTLARSAAEQRKSLTVERDFAADRSSLTFAAQGVEVEVDTETGHVRLLRCVQALDIGKAINPRICEGQAVGGTAMRLGYALTEELRFDEQGNILNPSPRTYRIPLAKDVPPVEVFLVEQADPYGPFGAKGIGEISTNGTAPAIANAIAHATGVRLYQLPMTPERVWRALQNREGVRNR